MRTTTTTTTARKIEGQAAKKDGKIRTGSPATEPKAATVASIVEEKPRTVDLTSSGQLSQPERKQVYDNIIRYMIERTPDLMIPLLRKVYSKMIDRSFDGAKVSANRHGSMHYEIVTDEGTELYYLVVDLLLDVKFPNGEVITFHLEFQSTVDNLFIGRTDTYLKTLSTRPDFQTLLDPANKVTTLPETGVVFLRSTENTPRDVMYSIFRQGAAIRDPGHLEGTIQEMRIPVSVLCMEDLTFDEILDEGIYPLIPFLPFLYHKTLDKWNERIEATRERIAGKVKLDYQKLLQYLDDLAGKDVLSAVEVGIIRTAAIEVAKEMLKKDTKLMEEVISMFDGTKRIEVLDIFHDGEVKGYKEGKEEGKEEGRKEGCDERSDEVLEDQIEGYLENEVTLSRAAKTTKMTEEEFLEAVEAYKAKEKGNAEKRHKTNGGSDLYV